MGHDITTELIRESSCEICHEKFDPRHRATHMKNTHKIPSPKKSRKIPKIKENKEDKDTEQPYCKLCKKNYSTKNNLNQHNKDVHGGFDPKIAAHKCDECEAIFVVENSLARHKAVLHAHSKGKGKRFRFSVNYFIRSFEIFPLFFVLLNCYRKDFYFANFNVFLDALLMDAVIVILTSKV